MYAFRALLLYLTASARYAGSQVSVIWCEKRGHGDNSRCFDKISPTYRTIMTEGNTKVEILTALLLRTQGKVIPLQARCVPEGGQSYSSTLP